MNKTKKLYIKAKNAPKNFSFDELCALAEGVGFRFVRQNGSHRIYKNDQINNEECMIPIQDYKGKAKAYQVRQLLDLIDNYNLMEGE